MAQVFLICMTKIIEKAGQGYPMPEDLLQNIMKTCVMLSVKEFDDNVNSESDDNEVDDDQEE